MIEGCSDHGCIFGHRVGMGTNGGCQCEKLIMRALGPKRTSEYEKR